jgi:hypothetical protein
VLQATNGERLSSGSDRFSVLASTVLGVSANRKSRILETCALCSDKPDAVELGGAFDLGNEAPAPGGSKTSTDPIAPWTPQVLSTSPRERFSVGDGTRTGRFVIRFTFPGSDLPDQTLEVTSSMTVPTLQRCLADLMGNRHGVSMFVAPSWDQLNHVGLITALYIPGTATPCPALAPGSLVKVLPWEPFHDESEPFLDESLHGSSSVPPPSGGHLMRGPKRPREKDRESDSDSESSSPPPLRLFPQAPDQIPDEDTGSSGDDAVPPVVKRRVLRHKRAILMKAFKREQRFARRTYRKELRVSFDESIQAGQDRHDADYYPSATEVEEEAWENYV